MSIEKTYESIKKHIPHTLLDSLDSLDVVKQVEEYRQFWKHKEIKVILLAESHVHTDRQDYEVRFKTLVVKEIPNYPLHYVRFVYCLGYGENKLLEREIEDNRGTPQFWKIFSSCVAEDEMKILKIGSSDFQQRFRNKVNVLRKTQQKGVWLLDASIVGLARSEIKEHPDICDKIIEICWDGYLEEVIKESQPRHIIVIGKSVESTLRFELQKLKIPFTTIDAPQAHLNSQKQQENYEKYQKICARYC